ncbi:MAG: GAF domain-containing protein [Rhodoglobus sp.]
MHAPGVDPDRVLFIGSGPIVGYGVLSYDLSISGEVARQVSQITRRGVDADIVADPNLDIATATIALENLHIERYDAVVLMLGSIEVVTLYPLARWRRDLILLLDRLATEGSASLQILVIGAPPLAKIVRVPLPAVFAAHGQAINRITESVVEDRGNVTFVPLDPEVQDLVRNASRSVHVTWAGFIAPSLAAALVGAPTRIEDVDEAARMAALLRLNLLDSAPDDNIQEVVDLALSLFDASGISFSVVDNDREWVKAAAGLSVGRTEIPRSESFCATTIEQLRLFSIADMTKDPRYRDMPLVTGPPGLRFYAGYPVEAPNGQRIGALSIIDTKARTLSEVESALLRELALRVQGMVWDRAGAGPGR